MLFLLKRIFFLLLFASSVWLKFLGIAQWRLLCFKDGTNPGSTWNVVEFFFHISTFGNCVLFKPKKAKRIKNMFKISKIQLPLSNSKLFDVNSDNILYDDKNNFEENY